MRAGVRSADNELAKKTIIVSAKAITSQNLAEWQKSLRESIVTKIPFLRAAPTADWLLYGGKIVPKADTKKPVRYGIAMLASVSRGQIYITHAFSNRLHNNCFQPCWKNSWMYSYVLHLSLDVAVDEDRVSDCHIVFGFHFPHFKNCSSHQNDNSLKLTNTAKPIFF